MAVDKKKLEHLKQRVAKFREKHAHDGKEAKGVTKPKKHPKAAKVVGKRGGVYTQAASGSKHYKKSIDAFVDDYKWLTKTEREMKQEEIKKAVTSQAATPDNKPADEATINGENKPSIQDAKTPEQLAAEAAAAAPAPAESAPAAPAKKEISFDGLFADQFSLGATLRQNPNGGGNVMDNMKKPAIDYVDRAKNSTKNQSLTAEQLSQIKHEVKVNKK